jgi:type I restriction enzyme S subunit
MSPFALTPLGEIAKFINGDRGSNYPSKSDFVDAGIPFINAGHLSNGEVDFSEMNYISAEKFEKLGSGKTQENDLLYCLRGSLGKSAIVNYAENAAIASSLVIIRPSERASVNYLYRYLTCPFGQAEISRFDNGSSQPNLSATSVKKYEIPLPPLAEQKRIAAILDAADALRAKRRESLTQLDTLLQSTFLDMFGDPVTNPKGWKICLLGKICDVRDGTHDSPKYTETGHPLLTSKNFKNGQIDYTDANLISDADFIQINKRSKVDIGDLVMPMIGTIGNPVLVVQEPEFAIKNVALIKFSKNSPDNQFMRALLCSHYFDHITSKANRGGTQKFVALKDLRSMPIPIPTTALQQRFATIVKSVEQQKARLRDHLAELDTLFASLQHRAFNGEL